MESLPVVVVAALAFTVAGFVKGVVGFGFPAIAIIILTLTVGLLDALALLVVPTLATNIWQGLSGKHMQEIVRRMWLYAAVSIIAIWIASSYLKVVNVNWLSALLGAVLMTFALLRLLKVGVTVPRRLEPLLSLPLGAINGALTGLTGSFMVPSVIYMQAIGFRGDQLVQAMGLFFTVSMLTLAISLGRHELISADQAIMSAIALLPSFLGLYSGRWARVRINGQRFQQIFLLSVLVLGCFIVWKSAMALLM